MLAEFQSTRDLGAQSWQLLRPSLLLQPLNLRQVIRPVPRHHLDQASHRDILFMFGMEGRLLCLRQMLGIGDGGGIQLQPGVADLKLLPMLQGMLLDLLPGDDLFGRPRRGR